MRAALIYNPLSGSRHHRREQTVRAIASMFESAGYQVSLIPTEYRGHAASLAVQVATGHDLILSAGGDGTAHEILQGIAEARSQCALGVLPFGTGNVLATDLALPRDPIAAAHALLNYRPRRIAAGRITCSDASGNVVSRYFTVAAGIGAHAQLIYAASAHAKSRGGMFAYYCTGFHSLFAHRFVPMRALITKPSGETIERTVVEAVAMRVSSFGGLLKNWRPGGALSSNELRLILLTRSDRAALLRYSLAAFAGHTRESAGIEFHSAASITCKPIEPQSSSHGVGISRPVLHTQADGEILDDGPITMSLVPNAFTLLMPPL